MMLDGQRPLFDIRQDFRGPKVAAAGLLVLYSDFAACCEAKQSPLSGDWFIQLKSNGLVIPATAFRAAATYG
jgi:hypothetical protein